MRIVLMGPPGAGKGTQGVALAGRSGAVHISTGDLLRAHVKDGTALGRVAQDFMDRGSYVPDDLTSAMLTERLAADDARAGFVLDGFPRTVTQVKTLDDLLEDAHAQLDRVIEITVGVEELIGRLVQRAKTQGRLDDTEAVIRRRQEVYAAQTEPLLDHYRDRGLLVRIDGHGSVHEVGERMARGLRATAE